MTKKQRFTFTLPNLGAEKARLAALITFMCAVFLGGGGSRSDILSLVYLRPIAFFAIAYALTVITPEQRRLLPGPFYLLLALAGLVLLQLVPLPYEIWSALPGRRIFAEIAELAGLPEQARPLSLTPARTWNAFFSLSVPLATFLLLAIQSPRDQRRLPLFLLIGAVTSVGIGLMQAITGPDSALYFYQYHTEAQMVGLLANRNHQGLLLAGSVLLSAIVLLRLDPDRKWSSTGAVLLVGYIMLLIPFVLILGSRAGLALLFLGLATLPFMLHRSALATKAEGLMRKSRYRLVRNLGIRKILIGLVVTTAVAIAAVAVVKGRALSLDRLSDSGDDIPLGRSQVLSSLLKILQDTFPWGTGFGSFEGVFKRYEPTDALSTFYLNQAHNDWAQFVIEGGLPAAVLLLAFVGWYGWAAVRWLRARRGTEKVVQFAYLSLIGFVGLASFPDYPLRVPIIMMLTAASVFALAQCQRTERLGATEI